MSSKNQFMIRCKTETGSFIMKNLDGECTVQELKIHLSKELNLRPECLKILCGYPPKPLADDSNSCSLKDVNICPGETIIVEKKNLSEPDAKRSDIVSSTSVTPVENMQYDIDVASGTQQQNNEVDIIANGIMMRQTVPSNNSCLFASVHLLLSSGELKPEKPAEMRKIISRAVLKYPDRYTPAFLGMSNKEYSAWILDADHWGGGIELAIFSEHFGIEIDAVDTISLKMHRFGENCNYPNRIILIYDGIHYDPLVLESDLHPTKFIFETNDSRPLEMAMEIAREAKSSKQYTDMANFTLKCNICNLNLRGDKEARQHAAATGHVRFGEILK